MNENDQVEVGAFLRKVRSSHKKSQAYISREMGVVRSLINAWERGRVKVARKRLSQIIHCYGMNSEEQIIFLKFFDMKDVPHFEPPFPKPPLSGQVSIREYRLLCQILEMPREVQMRIGRILVANTSSLDNEKS